MGRSTIPEATRAAAIADLQAGEQPAIVAERYGIPASKVRTWKTRYVADSVAAVAESATPQRPALQRQKTQLGELILDLLAAKLEASQAIAQAARDPAWLRKQSGSELASLGAYFDSTAFAIGDRLAGGSASEASDRTSD